MIHIACNIDSNFTIHCAVTLTSLFANNRNSEFCVHIIAVLCRRPIKKHFPALQSHTETKSVFISRKKIF